MVDVLSVADAANRLDVSPRRIRQLIERGELEGSQVGRTWIVDARSVEHRRLQPRAAGRPLGLRRAWLTALVADRLVEKLASSVASQPVDESLEHEGTAPAGRLASLSHGRREEAAAIRRLRATLAHAGGVTRGHLAPFRNRSARTAGFYGHPSALAVLAGDERLILSGAHGGSGYGADIVPGDDVDAYVQAGAVVDVARTYGLEPVARGDANVWIRPVPEPLQGGVAPRLFVAADLFERRDPRRRTAGADLLHCVVAAITWLDE